MADFSRSTNVNAETDARLARRIAEAAGKLLLVLQQSGLFTGEALGKAGDQVANAFIMRALRANRPADAILSEEETADPARLAQHRVWIVDPLDGTREYSELRTDWAVHIALAVGGHANAGAVALPGLGLTLCTEAPNAPPATPPANTIAGDSPLRMVVSRTRPAAAAVAVAQSLGAVLVPMGSAGAKAMAVVRDQADIYFHTGGQYEWDNCAPAAVAQEAGLHVSRADGSPLLYNQANPYLPDLLICRKADAERILSLIATISAAQA